MPGSFLGSQRMREPGPNVGSLTALIYDGAILIKSNNSGISRSWWPFAGTSFYALRRSPARPNDGQISERQQRSI